MNKKNKSTRRHNYDELFDEVCFRFEGKYRPKNEEERKIYSELVNDTIKIMKTLFEIKRK